MNGAPSQYLHFLDSGVELVSVGGVTINAGGTVAINSPSLTHNGKNIGYTHVHDLVQSGTSNSGTPV